MLVPNICYHIANMSSIVERLKKSVPTISQIPKQKYFMIKGKGNPNGEEYAERIGVLYTMSYAVCTS